MAPDLFAGDAFALHTFLNAFYQDRRFDGDAFLNRKNFFARRNLTAIVLEVPTEMVGQGQIHAWATVSLYGHAPEMQVSRWGLPLISHLFLNDPNNQEWKERITPPSPVTILLNSPDRSASLRKLWRATLPRLQTLGIRKADCSCLCPITLPYELGTPAHLTRPDSTAGPWETTLWM